MSKHKIRLKEHERNRRRPAHPSKQAYARSDKSIDLTEYPLDTDEHGFIKTGRGGRLTTVCLRCSVWETRS